jgi:hypothetical protein
MELGDMRLATTQRLFEALMGGSSAEELKPQVDKLPSEEREMLLSALYNVRHEVAAVCQARAVEIDRLLDLQAV